MRPEQVRPEKSGYYRYPTVHGDSIVFVCEDDLWLVGADGGIARRLTANPGIVTFPFFSPDGDGIAFTGREDGPPEVYIMDAEGGTPRRLTWLGVNSLVIGWSPSGKEILFATDWRRPFRNDHRIFAVPADDGVSDPRPLNVGPARAISHQPGGPGVVLGRNSGDPARWKRYRGGTAGTLWIDRKGDGSFVPLIRLPGNLASPMWIEGRVYFLSDHEGYANLYSCTPTGRDVRRHTDHEDFFARFPTTDGKRIVYHAGADIYVFDTSPAGGVSRKIDIRVRSTMSQRNRKFVSPGRHLETFSLHPKGHSIASIHRGGLCTMGLWEGAASRHGSPSMVRHRLPAWLPDGERMVAVSDEGGEESLVVFPPRGSQEETRAIPGDFGRAIDLAIAPAGLDRLVLTNQRQEVILVDLANDRWKIIERSDHTRIGGICWSPDGRYIAYGFYDSRRTACIRLYDTEERKILTVTRSDFRDLQPAFDPEGRYLYFVSYRVFDPVYDRQYFDLGFPKGSQPFLIPLRKDGVSPFSGATRRLRAPGTPLVEPPAEGKKPEPVKVVIDMEGIEDRVIAFPVPEGIYGRILGAKGRVLFSSYPPEGSLNQSFLATGEPAANGRLEFYDLDQNKTETVQEGITDFTLSMDAKVLAIRAGNRVRVVPSSFKADPAKTDATPGRESGWIDFERIPLSVQPVDEWRQMYNEAWRLQRDQFWTPDMSGHDWVAVRDRYLPLVNRVTCRNEFSDLLWEMQGELGTSHCYELGGDYRPEPAWHQGFLGADLELDRRSGTWRIVRIPRGDSWDERRSSPLAAPGLSIREGDRIVAIGDGRVDKDLSPFQCLVNTPGREIELTIAGRSGGTRRVVVKPLANEYGLRYRDWVETNRARVHEASEGRVGYVHVPDMGPIGYSEFHRYYMAEVDRDGMIIDVRHNGGGHVSQLLLEKLARERIGYGTQRWGRPEPYPDDAPMGPMAALTNEYAGSDGDIFSHCFKLLGLGPLIGKRTWGGVVGIWPRHALVDGTLTTQPEFAFWFFDVGWGVENYGTDPDIEVEIRPQDHAVGIDPQLDRAIVEVLKAVRRAKPQLPDKTSRPLLKPGKLTGTKRGSRR
jgi:tricorn protease